MHFGCSKDFKITGILPTSLGIDSILFSSASRTRSFRSAPKPRGSLCQIEDEILRYD